MDPVGEAVSATANSVVVENRSAGTGARAFRRAASTASGTWGRANRSGGTAWLSRRAITIWAVGPVKGGSPASIS